MADFYGSSLQVDVYMIAHHGAENLANKPVILNAVAPKAVFVSANPDYSSLRHPRCFITDYLINNLQSLCKPGETDTESPFYCGAHPIPGLPLENKLQSVSMNKMRRLKSKLKSMTAYQFLNHATQNEWLSSWCNVM